MPSMNMSNGFWNDCLNVLRNRIDAGQTPGTITLYAGKQPASVHAPIGNSKRVGVLTFAKVSAPDAANSGLVFNPIVECISAEVSAKPRWARISDGDGNPVFDCDVSDETGDATLRLNTIDIKAGGPIRLTTFSVNHSAA